MEGHIACHTCVHKQNFQPSLPTPTPHPTRCCLNVATAPLNLLERRSRCSTLGGSTLGSVPFRAFSARQTLFRPGSSAQLGGTPPAGSVRMGGSERAAVFRSSGRGARRTTVPVSALLWLLKGEGIHPAMECMLSSHPPTPTPRAKHIHKQHVLTKESVPLQANGLQAPWQRGCFRQRPRQVGGRERQGAQAGEARELERQGAQEGHPLEVPAQGAQGSGGSEPGGIPRHAAWGGKQD